MNSIDSCQQSGNCGRRTGIFDESSGAPLCRNDFCRDKVPNQVLFFDLNVSIADSTGLMTRLRLTEDVALQTLKVTVRSQFRVRYQVEFYSFCLVEIS